MICWRIRQAQLISMLLGFDKRIVLFPEQSIEFLRYYYYYYRIYFSSDESMSHHVDVDSDSDSDVDG
ncbi:hypothetical protein FRACYDRAFT_270744 [Fragilariopsis cylindrus CCMP1102]|uniref:Uncharacterized protein n=1 Tax=Fragilariopsis cylindrus CCMP1102 TaxID=635003 RepID=A0A1E7F070_9STRA|nr:hypothetical protein FRACYDRAFT_270744 [Fragilariopsis cylindrus CCMP1102]|eukprot:OEU11454.1 hypothetical protein FRACYDRAFT_270744 [Fragilariopsis cylindrus CCMP1102]